MGGAGFAGRAGGDMRSGSGGGAGGGDGRYGIDGAGAGVATTALGRRACVAGGGIVGAGAESEICIMSDR